MGLCALVYRSAPLVSPGQQEPEDVLRGEAAGAFLNQLQWIEEVAYMDLGNFAGCARKRGMLREKLGPGSLLETALYVGGSVIPSVRAVELVEEGRRLLAQAQKASADEPDNNYAMMDEFWFEDYLMRLEQLVEAARTEGMPIVVL